MYIINSIAPIFLLIVLGRVLKATGFFSADFFKALNRFVFWFALPSLLIATISSAELRLDVISRITLLFAAGTTLSLLFAWGVSLILKLPRPSTGAFIQGSFRGNGAFVGLPVIVYALRDLDPAAPMLGTVVLAPVVVWLNILGVSVLIHYGSKKSSLKASASTFAIQLVKNPLLMACVLGVALNLLRVELPLFLFRSLDALGRAALPLILMSIGASLAFERLRGAASPSLIASLIKVVITPAIGALLAAGFDLTFTEKMIAIFYLACPAAGMSYVMADVMGNDATLAGRIVALSTLLSAITLPIIIAMAIS